MTGVSFHIGLEDAALQALIAGMTARAQDLTPAMDQIGGAMVASTLFRFEQGVDPDGIPWEPTERGGQILVKSGRLRLSINHFPEADRVTIGTNVIYGATHQLGRGAIPARPYLGVSDDDSEDVQQILIEHLTGPPR